MDDRDNERFEPNNDTRPRVRREDSARQEPIRNWWNLFRSAASSGSPAGGGYPKGNSHQQENGGKGWNRTVDRGVKLSYQMLDDQIRQGQRLAQEMNNRSYGIDSMNRDFQELAVRSMRYYVDAASLFMDFVSSIPAGIGLSPFGAPDQHDADSADVASAGEAEASVQQAPTVPVATRVVSAAPATVIVDLKSDFAQRSLTIPGLYSTANSCPPITAVTFDSAAEQPTPLLAVEVPRDQPPGLYAGVLVDPKTGEPGGTVTLRIGS